jgi:hypothetical protein
LHPQLLGAITLLFGGIFSENETRIKRCNPTRRQYPSAESETPLPEICVIVAITMLVTDVA